MYKIVKNSTVNTRNISMGNSKSIITKQELEDQITMLETLVDTQERRHSQIVSLANSKFDEISELKSVNKKLRMELDKMNNKYEILVIQYEILEEKYNAVINSTGFHFDNNCKKS